MWKGERAGASVVKGSLEARGRGGLRAGVTSGPPQAVLCGAVVSWDRFSGWVSRAAPPLSILLFEPALDFLWKKVSVAKIKFEKHFSDFSAYR